jgi:putative endonuclease
MTSRDRLTSNSTRNRVKLSNNQQHSPTNAEAKSLTTKQIGNLGEDFVAQWLELQGWEILHRRWRTRWGEIDIIAIAPDSDIGKTTNNPLPTVIFIEVKTRRRRNWDNDGILAVNATKQAKIWQGAEIFLSQRPDLADYPCRFDVALVGCELSQPDNQQEYPQNLAISQSVTIGNMRLTLQDYIPSAFSN